MVNELKFKLGCVHDGDNGHLIGMEFIEFLDVNCGMVFKCSVCGKEVVVDFVR